MKASFLRPWAWPGAFLMAVLGASSCTVAFDLSSLQAECREDQRECDGKCVPKDDPSTGCNQESCKPCQLRNATATCRNGKCAVLDCFHNYRSCSEDPDAAIGCEINIAIDLEHCGRCWHKACNGIDPDHAVRACKFDLEKYPDYCGIGHCLPPWWDCNGDVSDGCERNLAEDVAHCGACNHPCGTGEVCVNAKCVAA